MNTDTNELFYLDMLNPEQRAAYEKSQKRAAELSKLIGEAVAPAIQPVPDELAHAAKMALGDKQSVLISKHSGGKLSRWSAQQRKARRKAAKQARKRNRR